jgi:hypothetical protein
MNTTICDSVHLVDPNTQKMGAKVYFVRGCSFVYPHRGKLFLLAYRQIHITK